MTQLPEPPSGSARRPPPRGKLKIFLGYAPGVGKTYKMLELARELAARRVDVVVDYVEGLPAGDGARLFEKFVRGSHPGIPGAGLGLAICRGIGEAHHGTITTENREGGGALFRITLPSLDQPPPVPAEAEQVEGDSRP
jgi:two-component system sensor histidine kinase KdpD